MKKKTTKNEGISNKSIGLVFLGVVIGITIMLVPMYTLHQDDISVQNMCQLNNDLTDYTNDLTQHLEKCWNSSEKLLPRINKIQRCTEMMESVKG